MTFDAVFWLANVYVVPFWILLILAPRWEWTQRICGSLLIFVPLALTYAVLLIPIAVRVSQGLPDVSTTEGVAQILSIPFAAAVGWIHYLVFDLFVARWAYFDSRERQIPARWVSPTLFVIYNLGPFGLLLYLGVRTLHSRRQQTLS
ncbi:MAG: ABA4-like family protein [Anaerolineae bacterium]